MNSSEDGRSVYEIVNGAASNFLGMDVSFGGTVPPDDMLRECLEAGTSLSQLGSIAPAVNAAGMIIERILAAQTPTDGPPVSPLKDRF